MKAAHYLYSKQRRAEFWMIHSWLSNVIIPFLYSSFWLQLVPGPQSFSFLPPGCPPLRSTARGLFLTSNQDIASKSQGGWFCPAPSAKNRRQLGAVLLSKEMGGEQIHILSPLGFQIKKDGASLVVQWLRICLPMQGTRVQALVWEHPTCRGATRPVSHNY